MKVLGAVVGKKNCNLFWMKLSLRNQNNISELLRKLRTAFEKSQYLYCTFTTNVLEKKPDESANS